MTTTPIKDGTMYFVYKHRTQESVCVGNFDKLTRYLDDGNYNPEVDSLSNSKESHEQYIDEQGGSWELES